MPIATFPDDYILVGKMNGEKNWFVYQTVKCTWNGWLIKVPANEATDLASTPRPFRKTGRFDRAAVLHDFVYRGGKATKIDTGEVSRMSRAEADLMFLDAMTALNVDARRHVMYAIVRAAGWRSWKGEDVGYLGG